LAARGSLFKQVRRLLHLPTPPDDPDLAALYHACRLHPGKRQLNQPVAETRFVVLDTETTGFEVFAGDEMIAIAMLEYRGYEATGEQYQTLIRPGRPIPEDSTAIHGIDDDMVREAPTIDAVLPAITRFIGDGVLVGHHINFDLRFLNKYLQQLVGCHFRNLWLDTMLLYVGYTGRLGHYTLEDVAEWCGHPVQDRHTALGDARAAADIFTTLGPRICPPEAPLRTLHDHQFRMDPV